MNTPTDKQRAETLAKAIEFAIENDSRLPDHEFDGGIGWLRDWNEGDPEAMRLLENGIS
ncbi:hypothetical protein [Azospirillum canadense]|uniref:hypothetical protein n=1 Tax=Azospirillum canadense TaxID=403962 RepID=UPI002225E640|nr:hypothetical protein [Azospirillum canadense]MCW2240342.1 hypothetical protein [Azospirillum canadense]